MVNYIPSLAAILLLELQQTAPAHRFEVEPETPTRGTESRGEASTVRQRVADFIDVEGRDYYGRGFEDVFITAPKLAEVLNCSTETARRRLDYFESVGVVQHVHEARSKHYVVDKQFSGLDDESVRSIAQITDAARTALNAAEED